MGYSSTWHALPDREAAARIDDLRDGLDRAVADGSRVLVVDMSAVRRVTSTTVAALLWARHRCASQGIEVRLGHMSRRCSHKLDRLGLTVVFPVEAGASSARERATPTHAGTPR